MVCRGNYRFASLTLSCIVLVVSVKSGNAQNAPGAGVAVVGGAFQYDISGTGTTPFGGLRLELPLNRYVLLEPGLTYARYTPQFGGSVVSMFFPEAQLQLTLPFRRFQPFAGLGLGYGHFRSDTETSTTLWGSAGAGARFSLNRSLGIRTELRLRANDMLTASAAELTLGVSRRFQ